jgi:hypothetical protein
VELYVPNEEIIGLNLVDAVGRIYELGELPVGAGKSKLEIDAHNMNIHPGVYYLKVNSSQIPHQYFRLMVTP